MSLDAAHRARYVTACQQVLALGVVLAALTPAASVVSLDVVTDPAGRQAGEAAALSAYERVADRSRTVPTAPVAPRVREYGLSAGDRSAVRAGVTPARTSTTRRGATTQVRTGAIPVTGYGTVGVTWSSDSRLAEDDASFWVRTKREGRWSGWTRMDYHDDHAPDPGTPDAAGSRPGTDPVVVGDVDDIQVRTDTATGGLPNDVRLAVVTPGVARHSAQQRPALDTGVPAGQAPAATGESSDQEGIDLRAATYTPAPQIFSRAQWGADERLRSAGSLRYHEVHAGFIHHTVTANSYTPDQVPGIIRSIYAYHTRSRGWSDIGYNFLVDQYGQIWEGRYGGVDRAVVGAHTLGYNEYSFAMSALGNYQTARPTSAMVQAYSALFAWKLSLHGVSAASTAQRVGSKTFQAINGHRDAGQTACPGQYLYAQIPTIRTQAAAAQQGWAGRQRESSFVGGPGPDLVVRRASDGRGFVPPIENGSVGTPIDTGVSFAGARQLLSVGDWDRDGRSDVMTRTADGGMYLYRGDGAGHFAAPVLIGSGWTNMRMIGAVGDFTGDGWPDLMAQPRGGGMRLYQGAGMAGFSTVYPAYGQIRGKRLIGAGLVTSDGAPDVVVRRKARLVLYPGNGPGGLTTSGTLIGRKVKSLNWVVGVNDVTGDGQADLIGRVRSTGALVVLPGRSGTFGRASTLGAAAGYNLVAG